MTDFPDDNCEFVGKKVKALERLHERNLSAREKYADLPKAFLDTEVALDDAINECGQISANAENIKHFLSQNGFVVLASIIESHANPDVAQSAVNVIGEIVDPENFNLEKGSLPVDIATKLIAELHWFNLLGTHLRKFNPSTEEGDHEAVISTLQCVSHSLGLAMSVTVLNIVKETDLMNYLHDCTHVFDDIALYACDILADISAFLLANNTDPDYKTALTELSQQSAPKILPLISKNLPHSNDASAESKEVILTLLCCLTHYINNDGSCLSNSKEFISLMIKCYQEEGDSDVEDVVLKVLPQLLKGQQEYCNLFVGKNTLRKLFGDLTSATNSEVLDLAMLVRVEIIHSLILNCSGEALSRLLAKLVAKGMLEFRHLMEIATEMQQSITTVENTLLESLREVSDDGQVTVHNWLTAEEPPTPSELLFEQALFEECGPELSIMNMMCQIILRLTSLGDKKLKLGVHIFMDENSELYKALRINWARMQQISRESSTLKDSEQMSEAVKFTSFTENHESVMQEARQVLTELREKALKDSEAAKEAEQQRKTERNRETRQRHKIRRMDAEMKRLQGIEDARYARKKQLR